MRTNEFDRSVHSYEYNLGYKKTFEEKGRELTADLTYSDNSMDGSQNINQYNELPAGTQGIPQISVSDNSMKHFIAQANYIHPFDEKTQLESGVKQRFARAIRKMIINTCRLIAPTGLTTPIKRIISNTMKK